MDLSNPGVLQREGNQSWTLKDKGMKGDCHRLVTGSEWAQAEQGWDTFLKMMALISGQIISAVQDFSSVAGQMENNLKVRLTYVSPSGWLLAFRTFCNEMAGAVRAGGGGDDSRRLLLALQRQHSCLLARVCWLPETVSVCFGHSGLFVLRELAFKYLHFIPIMCPGSWLKL